jgi:hypothetical protein
MSAEEIENLSEEVRKKLIQVAKKGKTITYKELMDRFRMPRGGHRSCRNKVGAIVGTISENEHKAKRPFLSVIVVTKASISRSCEKGLPGYGFFFIEGIGNLKRDESKRDDTKLTEVEKVFARKEQKKVWKYWQSHNKDKK